MSAGPHTLEEGLRAPELRALDTASCVARDGWARERHIRATRHFAAEIEAARAAGEITSRRAAEAVRQM